MKRVIFFPHNMGSQGCKALCKELGGLKVFPDKAYKPKLGHIIVNWGNSAWPKWSAHLGQGHKMMNIPNGAIGGVAIAVNKLSAFQAMMGKVSIPDCTSDSTKAKEWVAAGGTVIGRKLLSASEGKGIVILTGALGEPFVICPLYTLYKKKKQEFRVHVLGDKVIDIQEKRQVKGAENVNTLIRNHDNGWVFCREGVNMPASCGTEAIKAIKALGLDFGGVDVIYNAHEQKAYVLEVNTAPGLEGTTVNNYATAFKQFFQQKGWL